jgi:rhodanese-related sulfurtransferase
MTKFVIKGDFLTYGNWDSARSGYFDIVLAIHFQEVIMAIGSKQLVKEAESRIETISAEQALSVFDTPDVVFVDLRDVRELKREGKIPGAFHCPRGLLEFWIDPESQYHNQIFASGKKFVFYCNLGWRSALAADIAQQMGLKVCHVDGGFEAWKSAGGAVEEKK